MPNNRISRAMQQLMLYFPNQRLKPSYFTTAFWFTTDAITTAFEPVWDFNDYKETPARIIDIFFNLLNAYLAALMCSMLLGYAILAIVRTPVAARYNEPVPPRSGGQSLLTLWQLLLVPSAIAAVTRVVALRLIVWFFNTHSIRREPRASRSILDVVYPDITPALKGMALAALLWTILLGPATVAMSSAEAALVPATQATIVTIDRSGLAEYVAIHRPGDSRIAQSVALAVWSWSRVESHRLWSGTWRLLILCIAAFIITPGRSP